MTTRSNTAERILAAARELLQAGGPRAITIHKIAERVGISGPAVYKHFLSRDEIVDELRQDGYAEFLAGLARGPTVGDPLRQLLDVGERYVAQGLADPRTYSLLFMTLDEPVELTAPDHADDGGDDHGLGPLIALIDACKETGALDPNTNSFELAVAYWATCHGLVSLYLVGGGARRYSPTEYQGLAARALGHLVSAPRGASLR